MALLYYPRAGEILICRYDEVVIEPEMRKARPALVVGPRLRRRGRLVTVVPLSTTAPEPPEAYHYQITLAVPLPPPFDSPVMWAKCDMLSSVSLDRLDRFKKPRQRGDQGRQWVSGKIEPDTLRDVKAAILCGLGLDSLTKWL
ncbi:type II toxin-antitoxin system PemK/MazF family toxin [Sphingomonas sp.]|uniref:type II toxin-antitoxin system PemK/MazF family toxin n=1 Tax=Sphingomonas sp. TaxID=28214 RepID=UPI00289C6ADA|nr:type II toxin-antitoxin system PemK/MazF family toxin [Sphingomonas sp.]